MILLLLFRYVSFFFYVSVNSSSSLLLTTFLIPRFCLNIYKNHVLQLVPSSCTVVIKKAKLWLHYFGKKRKINRNETDYGEILTRHSTFFSDVLCIWHRNGKHK
jgi:hypothetical protein